MPIKKAQINLGLEQLGQNGQTPSLAKIISNIPLHGKYVAIHHFFKTRVSQTRV